ncbi:SDR family NAD(P)-dependent oxidoreductase [Nostoc sp. UHCC 0302]|uniref:SDR family NAD(P)-dependent oxidoreductase n=1 Tax=Nostoc sp. UHCC 0302 TaxID=3134896 RepID=UPI00311CC646
MTIIRGKTVLLTGASGGIGIYIARSLAKERATVVAVSRSEAELEKICDEIKVFGGKGISIPFDITELTQLPTLVQDINKAVGAVDIVINNAAILIVKAFVNYSFKEIQSLIETNLLAPIELTRLLLPGMLERGTGHIVNIASLGGKKGVVNNSVYSASKAGLIMWSDAARQELIGTGVHISTICPGYVNAGMTINSNLSVNRLAGISTPIKVANAVIKSIKQNRGEIIVNENLFKENLTKLIFAIGQFNPEFINKIYQLISVN